MFCTKVRVVSSDLLADDGNSFGVVSSWVVEGHVRKEVTMAEDRKGEPESNFARFVQEMSEATGRVEEYNEDPERVMSEAGLSEEEMAMVLRGDEEEIIVALGGEVFQAAPTIRPPRIRFPRRRTPPTKRT